MQVIDRNKIIGYQPSIIGHCPDNVEVSKVSENKDITIFELRVPSNQTDSPITVKWKHKNIGVKGSWTSNNILDKRFRTDWEMPALNSSISTDAPIVSLFDNEDQNVVSIAISDIVNLVNIEASLREEDNHFYFIFQFFSQPVKEQDYTIRIIIDKTKENFSHRIQALADWLIDENKIKPLVVPELAATPLYSTWYSFHQDLDIDALKSECRIAKTLGYGLVIIDDGWQTKDNNRGYDYTGDWRPDRFPDMGSFVEEIHQMGMALMLWYSVPFCGKKSNAYQKFKGKFLTENHYWAPVFDPRFPEVRQYLVDIYSSAAKEWNLDGFKLDFIDDFKIYPETETQELKGRDTLSLTEGVSKLILEIRDALVAIKPDILIEFRQQYINPALRELGNMFRAFDCPNDSLMNRVRTTDVKLICGNSAVHSDMLTWHKEEPVEVAALQFTSILFSVPQLSVRINERSADEIAMAKFYTNYWTNHKQTLLNGKFTAYKPLSNYPILSAESEDIIIYGIYEDVLLPVNLNTNTIHIINGKMSKTIALVSEGNKGIWLCKIRNCKGEQTLEATLTLASPLHHLECPPNGIVFLTKKESD